MMETFYSIFNIFTYAKSIWRAFETIDRKVRNTQDAKESVFYYMWLDTSIDLSIHDFIVFEDEQCVYSWNIILIKNEWQYYETMV